MSSRGCFCAETSALHLCGCLCLEQLLLGVTRETSCDKCEDTTLLPTIKHSSLFIKAEDSAEARWCVCCLISACHSGVNEACQAAHARIRESMRNTHARKKLHEKCQSDLWGKKTSNEKLGGDFVKTFRTVKWNTSTASGRTFNLSSFTAVPSGGEMTPTFLQGSSHRS